MSQKPVHVTRTLWKVTLTNQLTCHVALSTQYHDRLSPETVAALHEAVKRNFGMPQLAAVDGAERVGHLIIGDDLPPEVRP